MATRVAFVRGINVGGHRSLPMAELRTLLEDLGFDHVRTYIQSGNVVYRRDAERRTSARQRWRARPPGSPPRSNDAKGFGPVVFVLTADAVAAHLAASPFAAADPSRAFLVFVDGDAGRRLDPLVTAGRRGGRGDRRCHPPPCSRWVRHEQARRSPGGLEAPATTAAQPAHDDQAARVGGRLTLVACGR